MWEPHIRGTEAISHWPLAVGVACSVVFAEESMRDFRGLEVWQAAHQITLALYKMTVKFPREELYGLTSQVRRCSASIAANIAEACGRRGEGDFHRFIQIASGSASELDYHLILAHDLGYMTPGDYKRIAGNLSTLRRRLTALISTIDDQRMTAARS